MDRRWPLQQDVLGFFSVKGKLNPWSRKDVATEIRTLVRQSFRYTEIAPVEMLPNPQASLTGDS